MRIQSQKNVFVNYYFKGFIKLNKPLHFLVVFFDFLDDFLDVFLDDFLDVFLDDFLDDFLDPFFFLPPPIEAY